MLTVLDVLDVLIKEYRNALLRRGHGRSEIDGLVKKANQWLDWERQELTGEAQVPAELVRALLTARRC
jgi:hypothetical protein